MNTRQRGNSEYKFGNEYRLTVYELAHWLINTQ